VDNFKLLNFLNLGDSGANPLNESTAFKRARMFSKTFNSNLVFLPNHFTNKYKQISNLFLNDNLFSDSLSYGLKRQHNFLTNSALSNNSSTFFDLKSSAKWLNFNLKNDAVLLNTFTGQNFFNFFFKKAAKSLNFDTSRIFSILNLNSYFNTNLLLFKNNSNLSILNFINNNSDKKKLKYPTLKLFNLPNSKLNLNGFTTSSNLNLKNDLTVSFFNEEINFFTNQNLNYKIYTSFSPNQAIPFHHKSLKHFARIPVTASHYNFSLNLNSTTGYLNYSQNNFSNTNFFFYNLSNTN
jgi:hypothetical protein